MGNFFLCRYRRFNLHTAGDPAPASRLHDQSGKEENRDFKNSAGNGASSAGGS
jgi:hypothetical protein